MNMKVNILILFKSIKKLRLTSMLLSLICLKLPYTQRDIIKS